MSLTLESSIFEYFCQLEDPRVNRTKLHKLIDIVAIAILAVIGGADSWEAIETFGQSKQEWLEQFLDLPNGISHDTFARVFALDPHSLSNASGKWIESLAARGTSDCD